MVANTHLVSALSHFVALADCKGSGCVVGQLVLTRSMFTVFCLYIGYAPQFSMFSISYMKVLFPSIT